MKRRLIVLLLLLVGIGAVLWWSAGGRAEVPGAGTPLSTGALARIRVSGGGSHALAIGPDGSLWSWGKDSSALGQGNVNAPVLRPTRVGTDRDWEEIYAGYSHSLALKQDGSLWAWGSNPSGVLGDGTNQPQSAPRQVGTDKDWKAAGPGLHHSLGLKQDGTLWAWGANHYGQLGNPLLPSTSEVSAPVQVGKETDWTAIAVGALHNLALKRDGTLWTWGDSGQTPAVAMHSRSNHLAPVPINPETNWLAIAAGYYHSCALKRDGTLWVWGRNSSLLGNFPAGNFQVLRPLGTNTHWATIYDGAYGHLARKKDGSLSEFGSYLYFPAARQREIPGQWAVAGGGANFSLAVARDGTLWHWGTIPGVEVRRNVLVDLWKDLMTSLGRNKPSSPVFRKTPETIFRWNDSGAEK